MTFGNMNPDLFKKAHDMQRNLAKLREEMKDRVVDATSGGGLVTAFVNGNGELVKLSIQPDAVDAEDLGMLEDLIVAAVQKGHEASQEMQQTEINKVTGGLQLPGLF